MTETEQRQQVERRAEYAALKADRRRLEWLLRNDPHLAQYQLTLDDWRVVIDQQMAEGKPAP
jgi:hypothetical protein